VRDCGPVVYEAEKIGFTMVNPANAPMLKAELVVPVTVWEVLALFVRVIDPVMPPLTLIWTDVSPAPLNCGHTMFALSSVGLDTTLQFTVSKAAEARLLVSINAAIAKTIFIDLSS
jgi:hypothetical protein